MFKRIAWYIIDGKLFSPDGVFSVVIEDPKLAGLPNMIINESDFPEILSRIDRIDFSNRVLTARRRGNKILTIRNISVVDRVSNSLMETFKEVFQSAKGEGGVDRTSIYQELLSLELPSINSFNMSAMNISMMSNSIAMIGNTTHVDFITHSGWPNDMPLFLYEISNALPSKLTGKYKIYQEDMTDHSYLNIVIEERAKITKAEKKKNPNIEAPLLRKTYLRGRFTPRGKNLVSKLYNIYADCNDNKTPPVIVYPLEVYKELAKSIGGSVDVIVYEDGRHEVMAGLSSTALSVIIDDLEISLKDKLKISSIMYFYKISNEGVENIEFYILKEQKFLILRTNRIISVSPLRG